MMESDDAGPTHANDAHAPSDGDAGPRVDASLDPNNRHTSDRKADALRQLVSINVAQGKEVIYLELNDQLEVDKLVTVGG